MCPKPETTHPGVVRRVGHPPRCQAFCGPQQTQPSSFAPGQRRLDERSGELDPVVQPRADTRRAGHHLARQQCCGVPVLSGHHNTVMAMWGAGEAGLHNTSFEEVVRTHGRVEAEHVHSEPKVRDGGEVDAVPGVHLGRVLPGEILLRVTEESGDADDLLLRGSLDLQVRRDERPGV